MIEINELSKTLGKQEVLKNISLGVTKGTIFGLIGENGAGKTTLIKCLTGIYKPEKGSIKIAEQAVFDNPQIKAKVGYVADQNHYFPSMKIEELLKFYALTYPSFSMGRFESLNETLQLDTAKRIKALSKGMQMRLSLALNLSIYPDVMILDEPTSGLDPLIKRQITNILLQDVEERGTTLFISSHHLGDLERICDSIAIIHDGEIQYVNSLEQMKRSIRKIQVVFETEAPADLQDWPEIMSAEQIGRVWYLITKKYSADFEKKLRQQKLTLIEDINLSLEDMFIYSGGEGLKNGKHLV